MKKLAGCALLVALSACGHTKHVETPASAEQKDEAARSDGGRNGEGRLPGIETTHSENGVPLATSPGGLLKPDATKAIQERLGSAGVLSDDHATGHLDAATREALTRFQRAHNLPATGVPDDVTVRALGLDPSKIFEAGPKPEKGDAK